MLISKPGMKRFCTVLVSGCCLQRGTCADPPMTYVIQIGNLPGLFMLFLTGVHKYVSGCGISDIYDIILCMVE